MTTTGRPPRPGDPAPDSLQNSTPLRGLLNSLVGQLLEEITAGADSDRLRRYVEPLSTVLALERSLTDQAGVAREAVTKIQEQQMGDLATGVVMARLGCDADTARKLLAEWMSQRDLRAEALSPGEVQALLEEPDWGRR